MDHRPSSVVYGLSSSKNRRAIDKPALRNYPRFGGAEEFDPARRLARRRRRTNPADRAGALRGDGPAVRADEHPPRPPEAWLAAAASRGRQGVRAHLRRARRRRGGELRVAPLRAGPRAAGAIPVRNPDRRLRLPAAPVGLSAARVRRGGIARGNPRRHARAVEPVLPLSRTPMGAMAGAHRHRGAPGTQARRLLPAGRRRDAGARSSRSRDSARCAARTPAS